MSRIIDPYPGQPYRRSRTPVFMCKCNISQPKKQAFHGLWIIKLCVDIVLFQTIIFYAIIETYQKSILENCEYLNVLHFEDTSKTLILTRNYLLTVNEIINLLWLSFMVQRKQSQQRKTVDNMDLICYNYYNNNYKRIGFEFCFL